MMVLVVFYFRIFEIYSFCFVVAMSDLVHDLEAIYGPYFTCLQHLEVFSEI